MKTKIEITEDDSGAVKIDFHGDGCTFANLLGLLEMAKLEAIGRQGVAAQHSTQGGIAIARSPLPDGGLRRLRAG